MGQVVTGVSKRPASALETARRARLFGCRGRGSSGGDRGAINLLAEISE
jgi:hypothetical protein